MLYAVGALPKWTSRVFVKHCADSEAIRHPMPPLPNGEDRRYRTRGSSQIWRACGLILSFLRRGGKPLCLTSARSPRNCTGVVRLSRGMASIERNCLNETASKNMNTWACRECKPCQNKVQRFLYETLDRLKTMPYKTSSVLEFHYAPETDWSTIPSGSLRAVIEGVATWINSCSNQEAPKRTLWQVVKTTWLQIFYYLEANLTAKQIPSSTFWEPGNHNILTGVWRAFGHMKWVFFLNHSHTRNLQGGLRE